MLKFPFPFHQPHHVTWIKSGFSFTEFNLDGKRTFLSGKFMKLTTPPPELFPGDSLGQPTIHSCPGANRNSSLPHFMPTLRSKCTQDYTMARECFNFLKRKLWKINDLIFRGILTNFWVWSIKKDILKKNILLSARLTITKHWLQF